MKIVILVPDGAADYPSEKSGKTPLEIANTPNMDDVVKRGRIGLTVNCPQDMDPGSDVANMSILGYDPHIYYTGRGPLEALSMGVELKPDDIAFRCNLVTIENERMADYSAGHISSEEGAALMEALNEQLADESIRFYPGVSYRHLLVISDGDPALECTPPHDILGECVDRFLPRGERAPLIKSLMAEAEKILAGHSVNEERLQAGKSPATDIWPWGQGKTPAFPSITERFGLSGAVISAVDLIKGLGVAAGLEVVDVPGATGYFDTDYKAKAEAAVKLIDDFDLVFVHVEAPDEAGHEGNEEEKVRALERFDEVVVGKVMSALKTAGPYRLLIIPDHATPLVRRTHTHDAVPFALCGAGVEVDQKDSFTEASALSSPLSYKNGYELLKDIVTVENLPWDRIKL